MVEELKKVHHETPWWVRLAVLAVGAVLAILIVVVGVYTNDVKGFSEQNRANAIAACERGNEARVGDIRNLRSDLTRLKQQRKAESADIAGLFRSPVQDPVWVAAHADARDAMTAGIVQKRFAIDETLDSIKGLTFPDKPAVIDCQSAYPK